MDNLVCTDCGITYYSASAGLMVARGERCDCGAPLEIVVVEAVAAPPVGAYATRTAMPG